MDSNATGELREYSANPQHCSLREALGHATSIAPDAPAIYQESGNCLRYGHLCEQIDYVQRELQVHGISQTDCVAVILPQSVDLAVALLGVACAARAAPAPHATLTVLQ